MSIETRVRALEKQLAQDEHGETWKERIERFMRSITNAELCAQGIALTDIQAIAVGQWDAVTSPLLLASEHRERWERAAPAIIQMMERAGMNQDEHVENAN
jgi:hypothetical protein